jgi:hypothetical protein
MNAATVQSELDPRGLGLLGAKTAALLSGLATEEALSADRRAGMPREVPDRARPVRAWFGSSGSHLSADLSPLLIAHRLKRPMQVRLDRSSRPTQSFGNFGEREVRPVVEDYDHSLICRQMTHEAESLVMVEKGAERIGHGPVVFRLKLDEMDPAVSSHPVPAGIYDDPIEPGLECGRVAQRSRRLPSSDCRIMGDILGIGSLTKEQAGESVGPVKPERYLSREIFVGLVLDPYHRPLRRLPESA